MRKEPRREEGGKEEEGGEGSICGQVSSKEVLAEGGDRCEPLQRNRNPQKPGQVCWP